MNKNDIKQILRENILMLNEGPGGIRTPKGTFTDTSKGTYPFYYYYDTLYIGNERGNHTTIGLDYDLVDDCLPDDPTDEEEDEAEENNWGDCSDIAGDMTIDGSTQFNGRIFTIPKVISFWSDISKKEVKDVISDLNNSGDFNIDDSWVINYMNNNGSDKYVPLGEYIGHKSNDEILRKLKQMALDHVKGNKARRDAKPIELKPTSSRDRYKLIQMLRQHPELQKRVKIN